MIDGVRVGGGGGGIFDCTGQRPYGLNNVQFSVVELIIIMRKLS